VPGGAFLEISPYNVKQANHECCLQMVAGGCLRRGRGPDWQSGSCVLFAVLHPHPAVQRLIQTYSVTFLFTSLLSSQRIALSLPPCLTVVGSFAFGPRIAFVQPEGLGVTFRRLYL
jgi:hypothetical protein